MKPWFSRTEPRETYWLTTWTPMSPVMHDSLTVSLIHHLEQPACGDVESLGGKGWNLAVLLQAGLPVPPAFCISCQAYRVTHRRANGESPRVFEDLRAQLDAAYRAIGGGSVAVGSMVGAAVETAVGARAGAEFDAGT